MGKPQKIATPEKELRFTRARQALTFVALGVGCVCVAIALWIKATPIVGNAAGDDPAVASYAWGFLPLLLALWFFWVSAHCARHAFVILTPLGIELFPFWRPAKNMQVVYWSEIADAKITDDLKTLTIERDGGGKIFVALSPISESGRPLLKRAVEGRAAETRSPERLPEPATD